MKYKPEMFKRPCLILAVCIASVYLLGFYIASPLSLTPRGARFDFFFVIVFLPQFVLTASALTSNMPPLARAVLALALAFIPSLVHARMLLGIRKIFVKKENKTIREGIVILLLLAVMTAGVLLQVLVSARESSRRAACMNNVRTLVQMSHMYNLEYEGEFPASFKALDAAGYTIDERAARLLGPPAGYGLNTAVTKDCPPGTPFIGDFDSTNHAGITFRSSESIIPSRSGAVFCSFARL